jgi:tripartite-type tricarboxylate transporter receptor subunit TctC
VNNSLQRALIGDTPEELTQFVGAEIAKWTRIAKQAGAKAD